MPNIAFDAFATCADLPIRKLPVFEKIGLNN
jgi:hypothetical protein